MLFVQFRFLVFFLIVFCVHWALRGNTARKVWLLVASHFFYACLFLAGPDSSSADEFPLWTFIKIIQEGKPLPDGWWFPAIVWCSTVLDYVVGRGLGSTEVEWKRRAWVALSVCVNLGVLAIFKYYNFFVTSAGTFLTWLGLPASDWTLRIFLPAGISFYTFQSMSYSIEVYRRRMTPERNFIDLAFFIAFFPGLVAGPIVRAMDFLPQVKTLRVWKNVDVRGALTLFFIGFVKKACVSENVAPVADALFAEPHRYDTFSIWMGVLFYAVQIYCDFSGYTDMAIATARLMGYELTRNFWFPYFAVNITEFWRRWHISLSTWLRDYLYITLGGNRGSKLFTYRNLMLTMVLGGLWHGAAWTFVLWGALHGAALIFHKEWLRITENAGAFFKRIIAVLAVPLCFYWVCITWVPFRAQEVYVDKESNRTVLRAGYGFALASNQNPIHADARFVRDPKTGNYAAVNAEGATVGQIERRFTGMGSTMEVLKGFVLFNSKGNRSFGRECLWFFLALMAVHFMNYRGWLATWWRRIPDWAFSALLGAGWAVALLFVPAKYKAFIYFQF